MADYLGDAGIANQGGFMDPLTLSALIQAGGGLLGGLFDFFGANQERAREDQLNKQRALNLDELMQVINGMQAPEFVDPTDTSGNLKLTANKNLTASSGALEAMLAAQGLTGSGVGNMARTGLVSDTVSNLSRDVAQNSLQMTQMRNQNAMAGSQFSQQQMAMIMQLMMDPSMAYLSNPSIPGGR